LEFLDFSVESGFIKPEVGLYKFNPVDPQLESCPVSTLESIE
jgi:hypothetical protein